MTEYERPEIVEVLTFVDALADEPDFLLAEAEAMARWAWGLEADDAPLAPGRSALRGFRVTGPRAWTVDP